MWTTVTSVLVASGAKIEREDEWLIRGQTAAYISYLFGAHKPADYTHPISDDTWNIARWLKIYLVGVSICTSLFRGVIVGLCLSLYVFLCSSWVRPGLCRHWKWYIFPVSHNFFVTNLMWKYMKIFIIWHFLNFLGLVCVYSFVCLFVWVENVCVWTITCMRVSACVCVYVFKNAFVCVFENVWMCYLECAGGWWVASQLQFEPCIWLHYQTLLQ